MLGKQGSHTCSECVQNPSNLFCCCLGRPLFFCYGCVGDHFDKYKADYHDFLPIETLTIYDTPGYREDLKNRQLLQNEAIEKLRCNLRNIEAWKRDMIQTTDHMINRLADFKRTVELEIIALQRALVTDIEAAITEFKETIYDPQPTLKSPITKALRTYESGSIEVISCQTNFVEMRKSFDGFLFSIDLFLQTELEGYEPPGTIKASTDLKNDRKVNLYQHLTVDFCTDESRAALLKFGEFSLERDTAYTIKRGPIEFNNGVYIGEWNQQSKEHGFGIYHWMDGSIYTGQWKDGQFNERGRHFFANGNIYEGGFISQKYAGFGKYHWSNGDSYTGEFVNDLKQGIGIYEYGDKSGHVHFYIGEFFEDSFCGRGAQFGRNRPIYIGDFNKWKRHGLSEDGQCFVGEFVEGEKVPNS